jgi:hypothetical protein
MTGSLRRGQLCAAALVAAIGVVVGGVATPARAADGLISTGQPVVASSVEGSQYLATNAVDQDVSTRWASELFVDPQWIYVDLGRSAEVSRVRLNWERAFAVSYRVEVSQDAASWTPVYATTTGDGEIDDLTNLSGSGRYVRVYGTQRGCTGCRQLWGYSLWEFEVYGSYSAGWVKGGYYLSSNADMTADTVGQGMNLKALTTYRSFYDLNMFPGWHSDWIEELMTGYGVEPNYVLELKNYGGPPGSSISCGGTTYSIPIGDMTTGFSGSKKYYGYDQVTSGALDGLLCHAVGQLNAMPPGPINVQFTSERDTEHEYGITMNGVQYSWAQADALSIPAIQYMIHYFRVHNTRTPAPTFTAGMGGWDEASFVRSYVGGPDGVDYIQWDPYNHSAPYRTPYEVFSRTYAWLSELPAEAAGKQVILAEYGSSFTNPSQASWISGVPDALAQLPRIRMVNYFNSGIGTLNPKQDGLNALKAAYAQYPFLS